MFSKNKFDLNQKIVFFFVENFYQRIINFKKTI